MSIRWTQALSVGHATIDAQHQELFRRLDALLAAMMKRDESEVARLFEFLSSYVAEHFGMEERLMREAGYPMYTLHKAAHDRFIKDYLELEKAYEAATSGRAAVTIRIQRWTGDWLGGHIGGTDQALAAFLARRAA